MERRHVLETSIKELEIANEMLKINFATINSCLDTLFRTFDIAHQRTLYNYVEIVGIPAGRNEKFVETVKNIGDYLGLELSVVGTKYMGFNKQTRTIRIAVELLTFGQKKTLMRTAHFQRLSTDCFGESGEKKPIYINDYLTDRFRSLLFSAKMFAKQNGFRFAWYRKCRIFLKKNSWTTTFEIESEADFQRIPLFSESAVSNEWDE